MVAIEMQAGVERAKADNARLQMELDHTKMLLEDDRERDKLDAEVALEVAKLQLEGAKVDGAALAAAMARPRGTAQERVA